MNLAPVFVGVPDRDEVAPDVTVCPHPSWHVCDCPPLIGEGT